MSKKVIGALLTIVMIFSVFSLTVFAVGQTSYEEDAAEHTQTWSLSAPVANGDGTYNVEVYLQTNYRVGPVSFKITNIESLSNAVVGSGYYPALVSKNADGLVILTPDTSTTLAGIQPDGQTAIAVVTYTPADGNVDPTIAEDPKTAIKPNGTLIAARLSGSEAVNNADFVYGQQATVLTTGSDIPEPEVPADAADLALKSGVTGVVIDTHKTFGGAYAGVVYGFTQATNTTFKYETYITDAVEATNGGSLVITTSSSKAPTATGMGDYGTGTTIAVKNADGTTSKTYVVCIFGDVDGNGLINTADLQKMLPAVLKTLGDNTVVTLAANIVDIKRDSPPMHTIQANDIQAIVSHNGKKKLIDPVALAAAHSTYNSYYQ